MDNNVVRLAETILQNATKYDHHFTSAGQQSRTLDIASFPEPTLSQEAQIARDSALEACAELQAILRGPVEVIRNAVGQVLTPNLRASSALQK